MIYPNDENMFHQLWSTAAGELASLRKCICETDIRASAAFIQKRDDVAHALRDLSIHLTYLASEKTKIVDGFIEESKKRLRELVR